MTDFMIRFLICNIFISGVTGILLAVRRLFKNSMSCRMQYRLWFLLLGLLAVPFVPFHLTGFPQMISWLERFEASHVSPVKAAGTAVSMNQAEAADWMKDFSLSVTRNTSSTICYILLGIWVAGMIAIALLLIRSSLRLRTLKESALPLQNLEIRRLYQQCLKEMEIIKEIPIYSTAFLKSPVIMGLFKPCIYLPIHLISDYHKKNLRKASYNEFNHNSYSSFYNKFYASIDIRYMLLHELQHYKHRDILAGYVMNLAGTIYWFNPLVWHALKEMRIDRELACDTSVLDMLDAGSYEAYGNTLINFAQNISLSPFPFTTSLSGNIRQIERRIRNIASYEQPTFQKKLKSMAAFLLTASIVAMTLLFGLAPVLSAYAAGDSYYQWKPASENISSVDLSAYFGSYEGSFVLYDEKNDSWYVHGIDDATLRVAPNSTYKIYDTLFGLEKGIITPEDSFIPWDRTAYPFDSWNTDQTLDSAMSASVNWYFQSVDRQLGTHAVKDYIQKIGYGNEDVSGDPSSYWMESSLKISPVEQVELLTKLHNHSLGFAPKNINAVKNSIRLSSSNGRILYGKTGTGRVNGKDVNGWFVGFAEAADNTYFFATNIKADKNAVGSKAAEITLSVLSDPDIWTSYIYKQ